ncbi:MAG: hypothetical protein JWN68_3744 [Nocardioides sp.]|jgi:hypothetical protein|uniref:hypothetical protein n=1 Tax=Nocardioides sp. TaxID=35761 RepID=UPI002638A488|nr:hypothetical protein [Nocardioides sp.]MCW2835791.1 hypothetical protein [Nocardioides sp.]
MTFELANLNSFVFAFIAIAGLTGLLALGALTQFFASNRQVRLKRHLTIPAYYGNLLGAH